MKSGKTPVILVVDDSRDNLMIMERYLTSSGYDVLTADGGSAALRRVKLVQPDLILLDITMPLMDGYEVCARLQQDPATAFIPVIFCSALNEERDKARAFSVGAADYLSKPIRKATLLEVVHTHLQTGSRWGTLRVASEEPSDQKFRRFRESLLEDARPTPEVAAHLATLGVNDLYRLAAPLQLSERELAHRAARYMGISFLEKIDPEMIQLHVLPPAFCRSKGVVAIQDASLGDAFVLANPFAWSSADLDALSRAVEGRPCRLVMTFPESVEALLGQEPAPPAALPPPDRRAVERGGAVPPLPPIALTLPELALDAVRDRMFSMALEHGVGEVLLQPLADGAWVRFRVDARLLTVLNLAVEQYQQLSTWLREQCGPADAVGLPECRLAVGDAEIVVQVSELVCRHGLQYSLRIRPRRAAPRGLDLLGMPDVTLLQVSEILAARSGVFWITGPAGSGRTTTLQAAAGQLDPCELSIITLEARPDADLPGVSQIRVDEYPCLAAAIRAALPQQPDVLVIDALPDSASLRAACEAALAGTLVLASLPASGVRAAVRWLLDLATDDVLWQVAATLTGILAQRLAPRVCPACERAFEPPAPLRFALEERFRDLSGASFRQGAGCDACFHSGERGRVGVFALARADDRLRRLILTRAPEAAFDHHFAEIKLPGLSDDAFRKASQGLIPPREILAPPV